MTLLYSFIPWFLKAISISYGTACDSSLLLPTHLEVFNLACGWAQHLMKFLHFYKVFRVCFFFFFFLLSTSTSRFPVRSFFTVFGLELRDIIFSIKKRDSWSNFTSCNDSIMMNLGKSLSISELESDKYLFRFFERSHHWWISFIGPILHYPPWKTHSPWLRRGYSTSILVWRAKFRISANFWF